MVLSRKLEPLVSVIIPNYNYGQFLDKCLQSVLNQTYKNIEIILIDDGSTDNSLNVALKYSDRIRVLTQGNLGVNAARNLGIQESKGEFISLCDSDDFWAPNKIELQVSKFSESPKTGLVYCDIFNINEYERIISTQSAAFSGNISYEFINRPTQALILAGCSTSIFRRDISLRIENFDSSLSKNGEDWDFFRRFSQISDIEFVSQPLAFIRNHNRSRTAKSLVSFYLGNNSAVDKALKDDFYQWTVKRMWKFIWRFELIIFKAYFKQGKIHFAILHLFKAVVPIRLFKLLTSRRLFT